MEYIKQRNMKNQFVTKEIALKLQELGFEEECMAEYLDKGELSDIVGDGGFYISPYHILAPLWQQAIDWFREKHSVFVGVESYGLGGYCAKVDSSDYNSYFDDYYIAREYAIQKAIQKVALKQISNE